MQLNKALRPLLLLMLVAAAALHAAPAAGAPLTQTNLLANPGFEAGTLSGWQGWWTTTASDSGGAVCDDLGAPGYGVTTVPVNSGSYAAHYFTRSISHHGGVYQPVANVTPGAAYRLTAAGQAVSRGEGEAQSSANTRLWVGIDPLGGTNAFAGSVVWSAETTSMDSYTTLNVEVTAQAEQITVFLRSRPDWCVVYNDVYWDDVQLVQVGQAAPTQSAATLSPAATQTLATADANGRIVHTVQADDTLSSIAFAYGVTVDDLRRLNNLPADSELIVLGSQLIVRDGGPTPSPTSEPTSTDDPVAATDVPEAEPTQVAEVVEEPEASVPGRICVMSYNDENGNALRDNSENRQPGVTFVLDDSQDIVGRYTTDGISEPYCFADLMPGVYTVRWEDAAFTATTSQSWQVNLAAGDIVEREFGVQPAGAPAAVEGGSAALIERLPAWVVALAGALAIVLLLAALGAAIYFMALRPRVGAPDVD